MSLRTHCKRGHDLAEVGFYVRRNSRGYEYHLCKKCDRIRYRIWADSRPKRRRPNALDDVIAEAVAAYQADERALSIEARLHVTNQTLYRHLAKAGIKRHRPRRDLDAAPQYRCAWQECGALLPRGSSAKFCCREHYRLWVIADVRQHRAAA